MAMASDLADNIHHVAVRDIRLYKILRARDLNEAKERLDGWTYGTTMDFMTEYLRDCRLHEAATAAMLVCGTFAWLCGTDVRRPLSILRGLLYVNDEDPDAWDPMAFHPSARVRTVR